MAGHSRNVDPQPLLDRMVGLTDSQIAETLGTSRKTVWNWRNGHTAIRNWWDADDYACRLGLEIEALWPNAWEGEDD